MADIRISRVEATATIPNVGGRNIGPGQPVDLDAPIGGGLTVRDVFPLEWFEPVTPITPATSAAPVLTIDPATPAGPESEG